MVSYMRPRRTFNASHPARSYSARSYSARSYSARSYSASSYPARSYPALATGSFKRTGAAPAVRDPLLFHALVRVVRRRRRLIAALLLSAAAALSVAQLAPPDPDTARVVLAARDLPAGRVLTDADVMVVRAAPAIVPESALIEVSDAVGHQVSGPLRKGQFITDASLLGPGLLVGMPPGTQAIPLRLADPSTVKLVQPGQLVNVVISSGNGLEEAVSDRVLAAGVPVLWKPSAAQSPTPLSAPEGTEGLIVVGAPPQQAAELAGASAHGKIFLVLTGTAADTG
jgi:pilus assembly protein CpaB